VEIEKRERESSHGTSGLDMIRVESHTINHLRSGGYQERQKKNIQEIDQKPIPDHHTWLELLIPTAKSPQVR
jgi:hypothetical protein